ncbi:hypothetical protein PPTG_17247 [Phytophthora nicotianae INRA-310]|uniref:RxLR effector protein n=1 Tax=Phytophthora nicotianae (strain INRA-310) TaxID=761204 RepID=W2PLM5_PHYN3|nr:hypothetical protein PPTG_17247 [Phytophthora nicotianae INRA-310]ETN01526.1 hypothetical protein PPTG_17247 [Phytophthora nicotianae INRA-310]
MRLTYVLLLASGAFLLDISNALLSYEDPNKIVSLKHVHYSAEAQQVEGRSLRTREDEDINTDQAEEDRGLLDMFSSSVSKAASKKYLRNSELYDKMRHDNSKYFETLAAWKAEKYSVGKVERAMKKLGRDSDEITYITNGYKAFLENGNIRLQ